MLFQRASGEARTYAAMWSKYKRRVLLAMSSQAFAQLVSFVMPLDLSADLSFIRTESMVCQVFTIWNTPYNDLATVISYYARKSPCRFCSSHVRLTLCFSPSIRRYGSTSLVRLAELTVISEAGWIGRDAILMTGINSIIYVLSTIPPYVSKHLLAPLVLHFL